MIPEKIMILIKLKSCKFDIFKQRIKNLIDTTIKKCQPVVTEKRIQIKIQKFTDSNIKFDKKKKDKKFF